MSASDDLSSSNRILNEAESLFNFSNAMPSAAELDRPANAVQPLVMVVLQGLQRWRLHASTWRHRGATSDFMSTVGVDIPDCLHAHVYTCHCYEYYDTVTHAGERGKVIFQLPTVQGLAVHLALSTMQKKCLIKKLQQPLL